MAENAISSFVYKYFSPNLIVMLQEGAVFIGEILQKKNPDELLAIIAAVSAATAWNPDPVEDARLRRHGGPEGPMTEEINERVQKTREILTSHGLAEISAEKFLAAILLLGKLLIIKEEQ